jgi:ferric-dicitrate binding protein FerR (iron transport regulator)
MTTQDRTGDVERLISAAGARTAPDAARTERVRAAVAAVWTREVRRRRRWRTLLVGGSALATAAVALVVWMHPVPARDEAAVPAPVRVATFIATTGSIAVRDALGTHPTPQIGTAIPAGSRLTTDAGATAAIAWIDGGEVRVDAGTALAVDGARTLTLQQGAVYVDSHGASVVVHTPAGDVRDVGTRFEVRVTSGSTRVCVREGSVRFERAGRTTPAAAGDELRVNDRGDVTSGTIAPDAAAWAWTARAAPAFRVEGATLDAFLAWAAREGGWTIDRRDPSPDRSVVLHGDISGLTPREAVDVIAPTCGLTAEIRDGRLIVRRREGGTR